MIDLATVPDETWVEVFGPPRCAHGVLAPFCDLCHDAAHDLANRTEPDGYHREVPR